MTTERRADLLARLPSVQAIKEGWIYRSSGWIETVVNKRYAAIAETFLMTYQRKGDARPTKVWSLSGAVIGSIKETDCEIKAKGTSTVVAVVASRCKRQTLVCVCNSALTPTWLLQRPTPFPTAWLQNPICQCRAPHNLPRVPGGGHGVAFQVSGGGWHASTFHCSFQHCTGRGPLKYCVRYLFAIFCLFFNAVLFLVSIAHKYF